MITMINNESEITDESVSEITDESKSDDKIFSKEFEMITHIIINDISKLYSYIDKDDGLEFIEKFENKILNYMRIIFLLGSCASFDYNDDRKL